MIFKLIFHSCRFSDGFLNDWTICKMCSSEGIYIEASRKMPRVASHRVIACSWERTKGESGNNCFLFVRGHLSSFEMTVSIFPGKFHFFSVKEIHLTVCKCKKASRNAAWFPLPALPCQSRILCRIKHLGETVTKQRGGRQPCVTQRR